MASMLNLRGGGHLCKRKNAGIFIKKESDGSQKTVKVLFPLKNAFSIAEAMVTLLIVSVALAAMAPIMTKKQNQVQTVEMNFPRGALMFFDSNEYSARGGCPPGWQNVSGNYENRFLQISSNNPGDKEDAFLPDHRHPFGMWYDNGDNIADFFVDSSTLNNSIRGWRVYGRPDVGTFAFDYKGNYKWVLVTSAELYGNKREAGNGNAFFGGGYLQPTNKFDDLKPQSVKVIACKKE